MITVQTAHYTDICPHATVAKRLQYFKSHKTAKILFTANAIQQRGLWLHQTSASQSEFAENLGSPNILCSADQALPDVCILITNMLTALFDNFWHKCCRESKQSNDALLN